MMVGSSSKLTPGIVVTDVPATGPLPAVSRSLATRYRLKFGSESDLLNRESISRLVILGARGVVSISRTNVKASIERQ